MKHFINVARQHPAFNEHPDSAIGFFNVILWYAEICSRERKQGKKSVNLMAVMCMALLFLVLLVQE
ncbi:hypothetical protein [Nitrosomonas communis]|uniref:hypothetical protein n=1 Tax=Nitrosomonas communis TaxID=44574 RepID=UPI0026ECCAAB|nr:hypothetical protein [Nitrosomonas communis]MCO6427153.1 hypothetical protein [Nitrosomonas communis]